MSSRILHCGCAADPGPSGSGFRGRKRCVMTQSLAELGQISKAGGPFDLTAYSERRARRAGRRVARRANRGHALGRAGGRAAYDTVMGAGHGARQSVRGIMDDVARGAPAIAERTVDDAGKALVSHGSRLAGRAALFGGLGLAGGIGGGIALGELSRRGLRRDVSKSQTDLADLGRISKAQNDWKNIEQRKLEARNGRRAKRQGRGAFQLGSASVGSALLLDGGAGAQHVARNVAHGYRTPLYTDGTRGSAVRHAGRGLGTGLRAAQGMKMHNRVGAVAGLGGLAAMAGGAGVYGYGAARERRAESKIRQMRRKRDRVASAGRR